MLYLLDRWLAFRGYGYEKPAQPVMGPRSRKGRSGDDTVCIGGLRIRLYAYGSDYLLLKWGPGIALYLILGSPPRAYVYCVTFDPHEESRGSGEPGSVS